MKLYLINSFHVTSAENSKAIFARIKAAPDIKATLDINICARNAVSASPKLDTFSSIRKRRLNLLFTTHHHAPVLSTGLFLSSFVNVQCGFEVFSYVFGQPNLYYT